jgi:hypothetical protein
MIFACYLHHEVSSRWFGFSGNPHSTFPSVVRMTEGLLYNVCVKCRCNVRDKHHYRCLIQHEYSVCFARAAGQQSKIQRTTVNLNRQDNLKPADTAYSNYINSDDVTIHSEAAIRHSNYHCYFVEPIAMYSIRFLRSDIYLSWHLFSGWVVNHG